MDTYLIRTFGCQMNKHDSEHVAGMLEGQGMRPVTDASDADVIVFMTCCVRENADERLRGQVASAKVHKTADGT
ncbi:MAG: tRNA (N6-isopentenyl adenosine(37)-C2)-methylthiotransferase MiaB, partial [Actinomycetota bacterium]|nr:tRNA (N6-isopentenyl adenosine(37)-C2)-methylthiotransferase MiaB [Actinomycetota bacterium]